MTHSGSLLFIAGGNPWRAPALMLWGVYMALVAVVVMYMHLFLPRAPMAVVDEVFDVGWIWVGCPLAVITVVAACFAYTRLLIGVVCLYFVLIAALIAIWVGLHRTYRTATVGTDPDPTLVELGTVC
ncbi:hypothetical protein BS78_04G039100 [Paspalum vaginatum]|nr:hypothetical protein BS78_04G039100 [Paspalum vaginatum]